MASTAGRKRGRAGRQAGEIRPGSEWPPPAWLTGCSNEVRDAAQRSTEGCGRVDDHQPLEEAGGLEGDPQRKAAPERLAQQRDPLGATARIPGAMVLQGPASGRRGSVKEALLMQ